MKIKQTGKKILPFLAAACLACGLPAGDVQAAVPEEYTYTVKILAGNQGTFRKNLQMTIDHRESENNSQSKVTVEKDTVTIQGLKKDDFITFDLQSGGVRLNEDSRYYVKGIRQSGRDNNTVTTAALRVDRDADYVVAYGVKGDMTAYRVNYEDAEGNELLPSETLYGSVGDKPVVAYRYKEGYEPEVRALTKTLTANEADNVFTFVYNEVTREVVTRQVGTPGTQTNTVTEIVPGAVPAAAVPEAAVPGAAADAGDDGTAGADAGGDAAAADGEETAPVQEIQDQEVPLAGQDLKDLDEEETPASNVQVDKVVKKGLPLAVSIGIAAAAAAALIITAVAVKKHKNKKGTAVK